MKTLLLYLPVWHAGYQLLFEEHNPDRVIVIDPTWAQTLDPLLDYLRKEIRALSVNQAKTLLTALYPKLKIEVLDQVTKNQIVMNTAEKLVAPDEDVSRVMAKRVFPKATIEYLSVFLRWDRERATKKNQINVKDTLASDELVNRMFGEAYTAAAVSSDWWRHVGAVLTNGHQTLFAAANRHKPSDHTPYICGDVRQLFHQGEYMNYSTAEHAECAVIAEAARHGIATEGTTLYVTTYPCPYCARLIAHAGFKQLYFAEGYASLDGQSILDQAGVKCTQVVADTNTNENVRSRALPYQEK